MANTYTNILKSGLQASYDALQTKDANVLYFCTDTGKLYKGTVDFTEAAKYVSSLPDKGVAGKIYVEASGKVSAYINGAWSVVAYPVATTIGVDSDDVHVASAAAVYSAITAAIEDLATSDNTVKAVEAGDDAAQLKVTAGDDTTTTVTVPGVVTKPTWDASARKLTIPVTGDTAVEVNIGKDIYIDPTAQNGYNADTKTIDLYLNDGTGSSDPTKISIPAASLIDIYTGDTTTTAKATVSDKNVITVDVIVDPDTKNAIVKGENGLIVDLSDYAKTKYVDEQIAPVKTTAEAADTLSKSNKSAIDVLNGTETQEGSVAKAVADAKSELASKDTELEGKIGENTSAIEANTSDISALASAATEWGTF